MAGLFNFGNMSQVDPMGASLGLMQLSQAFNNRPRISTNPYDVSGPDDSMRGTLGLMQYQQQAQRNKLVQDQMARQAKLDEFRMTKEQGSEDRRRKLADLVRQGRGSSDPEVMALLAEDNPTAALATKKPNLMSVGPGNVVFDQDTKTPIYAAPEKPGNDPEPIRLMRAAGIDPNSPHGKQMLTQMLNKKMRGEGDSGGPFQGTGMEQQVMNILLRGDPSTPEYAAAFVDRAQPRVSFDPTTGTMVQVKPDMSAFRPPTYRGSVAQPAAAPPAEPPAQTAAPSLGEQAPSQNIGPGVTVSQVAQPRATEAQRKKLTDARAGATAIITSLNDFVDTRKNAGPLDKAKSMAGINTPLNTSYNVAALLAKGEELFNLGVLNGPDLDIIRRTLPDPSTFKGTMTSDKDTEVAVDKVINLLATRVNAIEREMGQPLTSFARQPKAAEGGGLNPEDAALVNKYLGVRPNIGMR